MSAPAPGPGRGPWAIERSVASTILVGSVLVLLLLALAAAIELPERQNRSQSVDASNVGGAGGFGAPGSGLEPGAGGSVGGGDDGQSGSGGTIDLGNGVQIPVEPIPGCPGGMRLGDAMIVPDPAACGFEALEPGAGPGQEILVPDPNGSIDRFGLNGDGTIQALGPTDRADIEFGIGLLPDGRYTFLLPDGSIVPIDPGQIPSGLPDDPFGAQLPPNAEPAEPEQFDPSSPDPADAARNGEDDENSGVFWLLGALVILALSVIAWLVYRRTRRTEDAPATVEREVTQSYAVEMNALDLLLWEIDQEKDPRQAIQRSFAALETGLDRPDMARGRSETADAYVQRVLLRFDGLEAPLREFAELFEKARYSQHEITPEMRDRAVTALVEARSQFARAAENPPKRPNVAAASARAS